VLKFRLKGSGRIIGAGNGDPSYLGEDHPKGLNCREFSIPAFNGLAQVLVQSGDEASVMELTGSSGTLKAGSVSISTR
jgi:beta-galactosidase